LIAFFRIDCQIAAPRATARPQRAPIGKKQLFRGHAPLIIEYFGCL